MKARHWTTRKRLALAVAVVLVAVPVAYAVSAAQAQTEMRFACAKKSSGELRYVKRAGACTAGERLIRFAGSKSRTTCAHRGGFVYAVASPAACSSAKHRPSLTIVLPDDVRRNFCADKATGRLRSTRHAPYTRRRPPRAGGTACKSSEKKVFVKATGKRPRAVDDEATVDEDHAASLAVLANDVARKNKPLEVASVNATGTQGSVAIAADGLSVTYDPNGKFEGLGAGATATDAFSYVATDGKKSDGASVTVTVTGVNDAPSAVADSGSTDEDTAITIAVSANDSDPDQGDVLSVSAVNTTGTAGAVTINPNGTVGYDPAGAFDDLAPGEQQVDSFGYTISDGHGGTASATVSVTVSGVNDAASVTTSAGALAYTENDPATVIDAGLTVADPDDTSLEGARVRVSAGFQADDELLFTDQNGITGSYDAGAGVLTLSGTSSVANYQAALRSMQYRHTGDDPSAAKTIEFRADDGEGLGPAATRAIAVTPVDDAPTAVDDSATVGEDSGASAIDVLANDANADGGPLSIASASDPANGTVVLTGGTLGAHTGLTYQPDPGYCNDPPGTSPDTFAYTLNGGSTATVSVTVTCADDAPVAVDDSATVAEDAGASAIDVLANDTDTDGGPMSVASVTQPANGAVVITGGGAGLTYEPDPNYCNEPGRRASPDTFTYTLNGGDSATVSVTVTCVDDIPIAVNDSATVAEDSAASAIDVLANDDNDDGGPMSVASVTQPANGAVVITGGGAGLTYEPDPNYCNSQAGGSPDTFTYTLNGGSTATVSVSVTCVDDAPTAVDDTATVGEDSGASAIDVLANDLNGDGGPMSIASASDPANGTVVLTGGTLGAHTGLTYQPDPGYCNDPPGTTPDTFAYTINGGSTATVSVKVTCPDDAPTAVDDSATVAEDSGASAIDVLANDTDTDGGPKAIASASDPANGTVVLTGGTAGAHTGLTYEPDPNYCNDPPGTTPDTFTYTLNGGSTRPRCRSR